MDESSRERPHLLDRISAGFAVIASLGLLAMTLIVGFEVAARYLFGAPTIWAWDVNVQLMMLLVMLGLAEVYRRDANVRVDVVTARLSPRARAILDILCAPLFFFIVIVIVWTGWLYFQQSWERGQTAPTIFGPPLWPVKFTIPLGGTLLLLQGISKLIRDVRIAIGHDPRGGERAP